MHHRGGPVSLRLHRCVGGSGHRHPFRPELGQSVPDRVLITPGDTLAGLWRGSLQAPISEFLTDPFFYDTSVWTGTLPNGSSAGSFTLGSGSEFGSLPGYSNKSNGEWVETEAVPSNFSNNMYAISQVLTAVPEPSTSCMALAGLACGWCSMWLQRTRA